RSSVAVVSHCNLLNDTNSHRLLVNKGSLSPLLDSVSCVSAAMSAPYELSIEEIPLLGQIYHLGHEAVDAFLPYPDLTTKTPLDEMCRSPGFPKSNPETHRNIIHYLALDS
ncbi:hypothetical protein B0H11DRAFT_1699667, partial [Mycena galericulata]